MRLGTHAGTLRTGGLSLEKVEHSRPRRRRTPPGADACAGQRHRCGCRPVRRRARAATWASSGSYPPQASLSRSAPARQTASRDLVPPGVDADDDVGVPVPDGSDEVDGAIELLADVDVVAGTGLHPADVDDLGPSGDSGVDGRPGRLSVAERATPVEERVGRPVDDRHHEPLLRAEDAIAQPQLPWLNHLAASPRGLTERADRSSAWHHRVAP